MFSINRCEKIIERMNRLNDAVNRARAYLSNGDHADWHGFRPLFGGANDRLPHPDWVANVFLPRTLAALNRCEKTLESLEAREKQRRIIRSRKMGD
jgi:hypothetical protein